MSFALSFLDYNLIGSSAVDDESRILWVRNIRDRVERATPFITYDGDPYPVALDGRVVWVIDGYTTSSRYPYAQNAERSQLTETSGLDFDFNYIRNSVKAVVDAYDGSMTFYVVDENDPIMRAWQSAFHDLFTPKSEMPAGLADHLRYPEELFRVQTAHYSKYRLSADRFFDRTGAWSVAQAPNTVPRTATASATTPADSGTATPPADFAEEAGLGAVHAVLLDVPRARPGRAHVPAVPTVRAVQHRRQPHRAAGLHDRQQRSRPPTGS